MGEASRKKRDRQELLEQLAQELRNDRWTLAQVLKDLQGRGIPLGVGAESPPSAPAPGECAGCDFARAHPPPGMPPELGDLILATLHQMKHGQGRQIVEEPPLAPDVITALALSKGLAVTRLGPWRVVLQHLEGCFLLTIRMEDTRSTLSDWKRLGDIAARLGAPKDPLIPVEKLSPDHAIVWRWPAPTVGEGTAPVGTQAPPADAPPAAPSPGGGGGSFFVRPLPQPPPRFFPGRPSDKAPSPGGSVPLGDLQEFYVWASEQLAHFGQVDELCWWGAALYSHTLRRSFRELKEPAQILYTAAWEVAERSAGMDLGPVSSFLCEVLRKLGQDLDERRPWADWVGDLTLLLPAEHLVLVHIRAAVAELQGRGEVTRSEFAGQLLRAMAALKNGGGAGEGAQDG